MVYRFLCLFTQHNRMFRPENKTPCSDWQSQGAQLRHLPESLVAVRRRHSSGVSDVTAARDASLTVFTLNMCANWSASHLQTCVVMVLFWGLTVASLWASAPTSDLIKVWSDILRSAYWIFNWQQFKICYCSSSIFWESEN